MAAPRVAVAILALAAQLVAAGSVAESGTAPSSSGSSSAGRLNVFFMIVDDMRPSLGAYNVTMPGSNAMAHTPNIDKLASESLTFKRAYVQYAYCAPCRNSFLSGRRPDTDKVWEFIDHFRQTGAGTANGANWQSMPEYFKNKGYLTMGSGKLFHPGVPPDNDYPKSWTEPYPYFTPECTAENCAIDPDSEGCCWNSDAKTLTNGANGAYECVMQEPSVAELAAGGRCQPYEEAGFHHPVAPGCGPTFCATNTSKDEEREFFQLEDQRIAARTIQHFRIAKQKKQNFFIANGFHKPHVPHVFPGEFLQYYPQNVEEIPLARMPYMPVDAPNVAWHWPSDVVGMNTVPCDTSTGYGCITFNETSLETRSRLYRRSYYAAISYT